MGRGANPQKRSEGEDPQTKNRLRVHGFVMRLLLPFLLALAITFFVGEQHIGSPGDLKKLWIPFAIGAVVAIVWNLLIEYGRRQK